MSNTALQIQAILFATAESHTLASLSKRLEVSLPDINDAVKELAEALAEQAYMIVHNEGEVALVIRPEHTALIETIRKEELSKDLSKASAEVLAIIAYHSGATKADIEFIRGVNSAYSIRALQMRGLIEAKSSGRTTQYYPTLDLLQSYGVSSIEGLPQYTETKQKMDQLLAVKEEKTETL